MAEEHALQDLVGVALDQRLGDHLVLADGGVHVLLQVHREELEDEVQAVLLHDHVLREQTCYQGISSNLQQFRQYSALQNLPRKLKI